MNLFQTNLVYHQVKALCTALGVGQCLVHQEMIDEASFFIVQELLLRPGFDARP